MPDPTWPSSPPEANYLRLAGSGAAGTATTMANAAAWQALMGSHEIAFSVSTLNTAVTALNFEGVGGVSSTGAITGLNTALQLLAGWVQAKPPIAAGAVAAYEAAVSAMIPAAVSVANRMEQAADVAMNPLVFGALTPAIVALDAVYFGEHWPHNASTGAVYGAALTALVTALAVPPPLSPPGASPAAPAAASAAVAQATGRVAAGAAMKESSQASKLAGDGFAGPAEAVGQAGQLGSMMAQPMQAAAGALQAAMGMFQAPMQALQGLSGVSRSPAGPSAGMSGGPFAVEARFPAEVLAGAGASGAGGIGGLGNAGAGTGGSGASAGGVGAGGGIPGPGLTSYTRPNSSFEPENAGRPASLKTGLLSATDLRGPTTPPVAGGAVPVSPAHSGMLGHGRDASDKDLGTRARVVLGADPRPETRHS